MVETIVDKTTTIKTSERVKIKAVPFARGYKLQIEWAFNPDNSYHLDQVIKWESSDMKKALNAFVKNIVQGELHGNLILD